MNSNADFDGKTYDPALDKSRLKSQLGRVFDVMADGRWHTLADIEEAIFSQHGKCDSQPGISARIRDLRKPKFGGYEIEHRRVTLRAHNLSEPIKTGTWEYRIANFVKRAAA